MDSSKEHLALLEELKLCIHEIVKDQAQDPAKPLGDEHFQSFRLLYLIERVLNKGLRDIALLGTTVFWDYLENLEDCMPGGDKFIRDIASISMFDVARGRLFIRRSLNNRCLNIHLEALIWNKKITNKYYKPASILANDEYVSMLLMLLENLKTVKFSFHTLDKGLNNPSLWESIPAIMLPMRGLPAAGPQSLPPTNPSSQTASPQHQQHPLPQSSPQSSLAPAATLPPQQASPSQASPASQPPSGAQQLQFNSLSTQPSLVPQQPPATQPQPQPQPQLQQLLPPQQQFPPPVSAPAQDDDIVVIKKRKKVLKKVAQIAPPSPVKGPRSNQASEPHVQSTSIQDDVVSQQDLGPESESKQPVEPQQQFLQPPVVAPVATAVSAVEPIINVTIKDEPSEQPEQASPEALEPIKEPELDSAPGALDAPPAEVVDESPATEIVSTESPRPDDASPQQETTTDREEPKDIIVDTEPADADAPQEATVEDHQEEVAAPTTPENIVESSNGSQPEALPQQASPAVEESLDQAHESQWVEATLAPPIVVDEPSDTILPSEPSSEASENAKEELDEVPAAEGSKDLTMQLSELVGGQPGAKKPKKKKKAKTRVIHHIEVMSSSPRAKSPVRPSAFATRKSQPTLSPPMMVPLEFGSSSQVNSTAEPSPPVDAASFITEPQKPDTIVPSNSTPDNDTPSQDISVDQLLASIGPLSAPSSRPLVVEPVPVFPAIASVEVESIIAPPGTLVVEPIPPQNTQEKTASGSPSRSRSRSEGRAWGKSNIMSSSPGKFADAEFRVSSTPPKSSPPSVVTTMESYVPIYEGDSLAYWSSSPVSAVANTSAPISVAGSSSPRSFPRSDRRFGVGSPLPVSLTLSPGSSPDDFVMIDDEPKDSIETKPQAPPPKPLDPFDVAYDIPTLRTWSSTTKIEGYGRARLQPNRSNPSLGSNFGSQYNDLEASTPAAASILGVEIIWNYHPPQVYKKVIAPRSTITPSRSSYMAFNEELDSDSSASTTEKIVVKEPEPEMDNDRDEYKRANPRNFFVIDIIAKKPLSDKNNVCAECGTELEKKLIGGPRYCHYTGNYYCNNCHQNRKAIIPAKIIANWDFREYKVCNTAKSLIESNLKNPVLDVETVNPKLKDWVPSFTRVKRMRSKLVLMGEYIQSCRNSSKLLQHVNGRTHVLWSANQYSLEDLIWMKDGRLEKVLAQILEVYLVHITTCEICRGKGFLCEICNSDRIVFLFQDKISQCGHCKSAYHQECFDKAKSCPKCERVQTIKKRRGSTSAFATPSPSDGDVAV